jgi:uncharacterized membrane protein
MKFLFDTPLRYRLAFACIVACALFFRIANLREYSFFSDYDEYFTVKTVMGIYEAKLEPGQCVAPGSLVPSDTQQLLHDSMRDFGNNTLYNFLLGAYIHTVGLSDLNLRLFSVFFGVLTIILVHRIGREMNARNHHILLAAALLACNPILIHYADIIRAYSWSVFLTMLYFLFHIKAIKQPARAINWLWIGILGLAMFLSHYLMVYVIGTSCLFLVYHFRKTILQQRYMLLSYGIMGCCALLFIITNPQFIESVSSKNSSLQVQANQTDPTLKTRKIEQITLGSFADGAVSYLNQYYCYSYFPLGMARRFAGQPGLLILGVLLLILPAILLYTIARSQPSLPVQLALWMGMAANVMVFALAIASQHSTSFSIKYTIFSLPLYLIALAFSTSEKRWFRYALGLTAFISFTSCVNAVVNNYQKPIALEIGGQSREVLPIHRDELLAPMRLPDSLRDNCVYVYSEQEVIFLALSNPEWMPVNMCIPADSSGFPSCDFIDIRYRLLH